MSMIFGIGMDCVEIARMDKSLARPRFIKRVFSTEESALFATKGKGAAASAAACFAAKEAFLKACGRGLGTFSLPEIAALRRSSGAPYFVFSGAAAEFCSRNSLSCHLSLSHEGGLAFAYVVLEKTEER
ncbi:holo-ACP synthase [Ruminococcaceae bacterium OttesenSCG-928-I18]|nr:holo-ACP synthase [Ruminococcaceae bacterium OttesenSCG-928-I18]